MPRRRFRVSLALMLGAGLGLLMAVAVASVLAIGVAGAQKNTFTLLRDKVRLILDSTEDRVRAHMQPATQQALFVKRLIESGALDPADRETLYRTLRASLAAAPQVAGITFLAANLRAVTALRDLDEPRIRDRSGDPAFEGLMKAARAGLGFGWRPPVWSEESRQALLVNIVPVYRNGHFVGVVMPSLLTTELSAFVARLSSPDIRAFILYGEDSVLAHPSLRTGDPNGSLVRPITPLSEIRDPYLPAIWSSRRETLTALSEGRDVAQVVAVGEANPVFIHRRVDGFGPVPWTVGAVVSGEQAEGEVERLATMAVAGLVILVLSVLAAVFAARLIARPVGELVALADSVRAFDLASVPKLPRSRVRELDRAGEALNAMVATLRWSEVYLPRSLVRRLLTNEGAAPDEAYEREVTVMFTDVAGFSRRASRMEPRAVARFLNAHFAMVGGCVEAEEGTIDKYIGDAVMAFWGAPDVQPDHAARACRAALAITQALSAYNAALPAGEEPLAIRIGIATGKVLVGNIGAPGRVNFTLVGDTVNIAERLEQLGKELPETEPSILLSDATRAQLHEGVAVSLVGDRVLRGREDRVRVWRLLPVAPREEG